MQTEEEFLKVIIQGIVHNPAEVSVQKIVDEAGILLTIKVNKSDMGSVIGKKGTHFNAIKLILRLFGHRNKKKIGIKLEEPKQYE